SFRNNRAKQFVARSAAALVSDRLIGPTSRSSQQSIFTKSEKSRNALEMQGFPQGCENHVTEAGAWTSITRPSPVAHR
ncbi:MULTISPECIES: hypothetical protein, partial [unclassified Rhizobium]|uniref:hypothetical protein n=1 Tax=unclassified Rhizobium TaxID=2613769 RepID=UPI001ADBEE52